MFKQSFSSRLFLVLASVAGVSAAQASGSQKSHKAHDHGAGQLEIAFESKEGVFNLEIPAESLVGFEHAPKSAADKKKVMDTAALFESKLPEMLKFDETYKCVFAKVSLEPMVKEAGEEHADFKAQFKISCSTEPAKGKISFAFSKFFPGIKKLNVTFAAANVQKGAMIPGSGEMKY